MRTFFLLLFSATLFLLSACPPETAQLEDEIQSPNNDIDSGSQEGTNPIEPVEDAGPGETTAIASDAGTGETTTITSDAGLLLSEDGGPNSEFALDGGENNAWDA